MGKRSSSSASRAHLRAGAEARLSRYRDIDALRRSPEELLHELHVHQIELEMQNESLRQSQLALEDARDRYLDLYEFSPVGYLTLTPTGIITGINLTGAGLLGEERTKLLRRRFARFIDPGDRDKWDRLFFQILRQPVKHSCDVRFRRSDGSCFDANLDCLCPTDGGASSSVRVTLSDISALRRMADALREKTALLENVINSSADYIFVKAPDLRTILCNTMFAGAVGKTPAEMYGKPDLENGWQSDLVNGSLEKGIRGSVEDDLAALSGRTVHIPRQLGNVEGDIRVFESTKAPLRSPDGRIIGMIGVSRDVTQYRQAEEQLMKLRAELQQTLEWQVAQQTAAALAHELNQPLGSISILCEAARRMAASAEGAQPQVLQNLMERLSAESDRAGGVVRDLLGSLRRPDIRLEATALPVLLDETLRMAETNVLADCSVMIGCPPDLPLVLINRLQVQKVLMNLIGNSLEAMSREGTPDRRIWINVGTVEDGGSAWLTVRDAGPGVAEEMKDQMFHPFITTKPNGTGMGLSISRSLVETQGGKLWYVEGPGACFCFTLPFAR